MLGGSIVGMAIGLMFFFLLLSIITTTLQELIASWLNLRGRNLVWALDELIKNNATRDKFFEQPLTRTRCSLGMWMGMVSYSASMMCCLSPSR